MFQPQQKVTKVGTAFGMLALIYHSIVRDVRKSHRNAFVGLLMNILQTVVFVLTFYAMFGLLGLRGSAVRGDFLLYIMSGIFLYMTHTKSMSAVLGSEGPASAMMQHAPMNTAIAICASALSALYLQLLSMFVVLFICLLYTSDAADDLTRVDLGVCRLSLKYNTHKRTTSRSF